jgi:hypothetical protein
MRFDAFPRRLAPVVIGLASLAAAGCTAECSLSNCQDGCCDSHGICQVHGGDDLCGLGGVACADCTGTGGRCDQQNHALCISELGGPCQKKADCVGTAICTDQVCVPCKAHYNVGGTAQPCMSTSECCASTDGCKPSTVAGAWVCLTN